MSLQVNRWNGEIQEGIFVMLQLFIDLVAARLAFDPVPLKLMDILAVVSTGINFCILFLNFTIAIL